MANEKVLFESSTQDKKARRLEDIPLIRFSPGEKVVCVQRRHKIVLIGPLLLPIIGAFMLLFASMFIIQILPPEATASFLNPTIFAYIIILSTSLVLLLEAFNFMTWYYQFYIITNRALLHRHFFTIGGFYSDVVFLDEVHQQQITRHPPNFICDFLKVQDVNVYFHKLEREEPFIFQTPSNAQEIEDLLQDLTIKHGINRGPT
ncbi:MAG: hypothetical protein HY427_02030 [Candidatus Levybacteria bacterium]|nr:hypothetical protein [Candidatus Levybacteria bacterium]